MNHRQKLVQKQFLNNEEAVIKRLDQVYKQSLTDINDKIKNLTFDIGNLQQQYDWMDDLDPEKEKVKSMIQSKIYQKQYQEQLQKQVGGILNQMKTSQFTNVSAYLDECYSDGFIGTIFDAHGQGVPFTTPINQEAMVTAVQLDSKISKGLYTRLGEDVDLLKKKITAQVSRSIATGENFAQTALMLAGYTKIGYNNAIRIVRTEGHRIQTTAAMDAMTAAKERGADIVKQWDSTLDAKTRNSHVAVDGEIRELGKKFSNGLNFPGDPHGKAAEVINCRCGLLQRARWNLEDEDQSFTKYNGFTDQIETFDSPEDYNEFKKAFFSKENKQYMEYVEKLEERYGTKDFAKLLDKMTDKEYNNYSALLAVNPIYYKKTTGKSLTNSGKSDKISFGNITGAYNNKNDPEGIMRKQHAEKYYSALRNSKKAFFVATVSKNADVESESVSKMFDHLLINEYDLGKGYSRFDEDYDIAESLRRLREGKNIQTHDMLLIKHEALEYDLMHKDGLSYEEAHTIASKTFDYKSALDKWLDENEG